jgi:hypothetical protein
MKRIFFEETISMNDKQNHLIRGEADVFAPKEIREG